MAPLVWYVGDRSPSISDTITIDEVPFNLTTPGSTVVFKMRAANSSTLKVNAPATIVDGPNGEVRYDWLSADVDTAGDFLAWWEVTTGGKVQAVGEVFIEFRAHAPDSRVLCTRPDVIRLVPGYRDDPVTDGIIDDLIQAESQTWFRETGREIVPISSGSSARLFDVGLAEERSRQVWIGDAATVTTVKLQDQTGATLETVASGDYVPIQRTRESWEPIRGLWFPTGSLAPATVAAGRVLEVTGTWGFPSVPHDIRLAVARMTLVRYLADAAPAGSALSDALNEQGFDVAMAFASAQSTKHSYGIPLVA